MYGASRTSVEKRSSPVLRYALILVLGYEFDELCSSRFSFSGLIRTQAEEEQNSGLV